MARLWVFGWAWQMEFLMVGLDPDQSWPDPVRIHFCVWWSFKAITKEDIRSGSWKSNVKKKMVVITNLWILILKISLLWNMFSWKSNCDTASQSNTKHLTHLSDNSHVSIVESKCALQNFRIPSKENGKCYTLGNPEDFYRKKQESRKKSPEVAAGTRDAQLQRLGTFLLSSTLVVVGHVNAAKAGKGMKWMK